MPRTHWEKIADEIRTGIENGELKPGDRLPSEREIVEKWGVSRMTAHKAMQRLQQEGLVTRLRRSGTMVSKNQPKRAATIGLLLHYRTKGIDMEYLPYIQEVMTDDHRTMLFVAESNAQQETEYIIKMAEETDGIICIPTCEPKNTPVFKEIIDSGKPVVFMDRIPDGLDADVVMTDNYGSSLSALRFLADRGHRRIAHLTENLMHQISVRERYEAYMAAMAEIGEPDPSDIVRVFRSTTDDEYRTQIVSDAIIAMLHLPDPPTAVFCLHDRYLAAVLETCWRQQIKVPEQLEILGFSDLDPWMFRDSRSVNRITQRLGTIGKTAAERMLRRLEGDNIPAEEIRIPGDFFPASVTTLAR